jgi:hypothetical protein
MESSGPDEKSVLLPPVNTARIRLRQGTSEKGEGMTLFRRGGEMHHSPRLIACLVLLAAAALLVWAAPASATYVSGKQTVANAKKGTFKMAGGLVGSWAITSFKEVQTKKAVFKATGTESFNGCMDVGHDGSCTGDPSGTMDFTFRYWAKVSKDGERVELGTCAHPVVSGTGGFAGATGFLMMVDTPIKKKPFIKTHYEGDINLVGTKSAGPRAPRHC